MTTAENKAISIQRTFNLPLDTVWKAWTDAESFKKWWGPKDYTCPECTIDFKQGGKYLACMRSADGQDTWSTGTYKEIIDHKKIVYDDYFADSKGNIVPASYYKMPGEWPLKSVVTIELEEVGGKTTMSLLHEGIPLEMQKDCIDGWQQCFDKLEKNLK